MSYFGETLKTLRLGRKMTQDDLASKLKMSKSSISMYENGNRNPDFETLEAVADFFNVDMNFLLGKNLSVEEDLAKYEVEIRIRPELLNFIKLVSDSTKEEIEKYAKFIELMKEDKK